MKDHEIRTYQDAPKVCVREEEGKPSMIEGYAVVFNSRSNLLYDWMAGEPFYETISRDAVNEIDLNGWDVKADIDHDPSQLLARSVCGKGSLRLSVDDTGVRYEFPVPHTIDGERACERIKRGELFGSSFAFSFDEKTGCTYSRDKDNNLCREVTKIDRMYDVSIVQNPAYQASSVSQRSMEELGVIKKEEKSERNEELEKAFKEYRKEIENIY